MCANSKQARAELRRGLGRPVEQCTYLHRYLVPRIGEQLHPEARRAHYAIASMIAALPRGARDGERPVAEADTPDTAEADTPDTAEADTPDT
ncbi:hypothetical protein GT350_40375, partial [Streptomyces sp. SID1034]|nr:hypothetical protein [Streptomyces sp. SID1034]